jgi:hypothetical protein
MERLIFEVVAVEKNMLRLILRILALVCFAIAFAEPTSPRYNRWMAVGFMALTLAWIV